MAIYMWREYSYEPDSTTLLYCPFTDDLINKINNSSPSSSSNASISNWSAHVTGWHIYYNLPSNVNTSWFTVAQWLNPSERRNYSMRVWMTSYLSQWLTRNDTGSEPRFWLVEWSSSWAASNWWSMPLNERNFWVTTWNWSTPIVYKNWEPMTYSWVSTASSYNVWQVWVNNQYDYFTWYIWQFIIDNKIWPQEDVVNFYQFTKSLYQ